MQHIDRRNFLKIAGFGGVVFASGLGCASRAGQSEADEFYFVQLSDTHWGFKGAPNPDADGDAAEGGRRGQRASTRSPTSSSSPAT